MSQQTIKSILYSCTGDNGLPELTVEEAHTAILKLIKEMVPDRADTFGKEYPPDIGFNQCRQTFLDRLEEMEKQT